MADADLKALHDLLLAGKPAGATHPDDCPVCATAPGPQEGADLNTYTEDELRVAVEAAVGDLKAELDTFRSSQEAAAVDARITKSVTEATEPLSAKITELQADLDAAVLATAAEKARADTLETEKMEAAEALIASARKEERLAKVAEVAAFPQAYLDANAERFAAMSDEDFEARLEEYRQIATKSPAPGLPLKSALKATTDSGGDDKPTSAVSALFAMRRAGIDPRTI